MNFRPLISTLLITALSIGLLLSTQGIAQQTGAEAQTDVKAADEKLPVDTQTVPAKQPPPNTETATRFVPTEKISADDAVSFPVDI